MKHTLHNFKTSINFSTMSDCKFPDISRCYYSVNNFNPETDFSQYHYWEKYNPDKQYKTNNFVSCYKGVEYTYRFALHCVTTPVKKSDESTSSVKKSTSTWFNYLFSNKPTEEEIKEITETQSYIIAEQQLTPKQSKILTKYCQCAWHAKAIYNPYKYITCACCVGCVGSDFPRQRNINTAIENAKNAGIMI